MRRRNEGSGGPFADEQPFPAMDHEPGGKESAFTWEMGELILEKIQDGWTMREITARPEMPCYATVFQWVRVHPGFGQAYRQVRADLAAGHVDAVAQRQAARAFWPAHKAKVDGRRWWRRGRPSSYRRETGEAICRLLRRGWTMSRINARPDMPSAKVVYTWMRTEREFRDMVTEARRWWLGLLEFHAQNLWDVMCEEPERARQIELRVKRIRGRIGRETPKHYR